MKNSAANLEVSTALLRSEAYVPCDLICHCQFLEYVQSGCFDALGFGACK